MASKDYFITNSKVIAKRKLKELFKTVIIDNVEIEQGWYRITWINPKTFYANCLESQTWMPKYLDSLLNMLEVPENQKEIKTDKQIDEEHKEKIYDDLKSKTCK